MNRQIIAILVLIVSMSSAHSQESRDYLGKKEQYNKAVQLYQKQNYPAAYTVFQSLIEDKSNDLNTIPKESIINAKLFYALSATYTGKQNGIRLVNDFLAHYPAHPNSSEARLQLAKYYFDNRNFDQALANLEQINADALNDEQKLEYNMSMGYVFFVKKQFRKAESYLKPVVSSNSANRTEATYYLALSQYFQQDYDNALRNLKAIEKQERFYNQIPYYFSRILFEQGKYQETIDYAEPLIVQNIGNKTEINQILGQSYFNLENYNKALPFLESYSTNVESQSAEAQYQLAYTQYQMGKYADAVVNFEKLNIVEDNIGQHALYALAESYLKIGEKEKAQNAFNSAAKLNFNKEIKENAAYNEAKLSYELGRNAEAINLVKSFIDDYPKSKYRAEADEVLVDLFLTSNNYKDALSILNSINNKSDKMNEALQKVSYFRAVELYNNQNLSEAKPLFDQVISVPKDQRYVALSNYWLGEMAYEYGRYPLSIEYMNKFTQSSVNKPQQYLNQANYTLGYSNYKQKEYQQAANYFSKVTANSNFSTDAAIRAADSYFALRQYNQAKQFYQKASTTQSNEADYAAYQIAILSGLNGNNSEKLRLLKQLYSQKTSSAYADDALFEYGRVFVTQENYPQAERSFLQLIESYPKSEQVVNSYNQLGLINYNQQNYAQAIKYYDNIVQNYSTEPEAATALTAIQEIYIEMGQPNEYFAYLKTVKGVSIDASEQEEIIYKAAEAQFQNANCDKASTGFSSYLNQYPKGIYAVNAHFYRGECNNQNGKNEEAIPDYIAVIDLPVNKFTERSLIRVARYRLRTANYKEAITYYQRILDLSYSSESIYNDEILVALMQAENQLNNRIKAAEHAEKVLKFATLDEQVAVEAKFIIAARDLEQGNTVNAQQRLTEVAASSRNSIGAEARYLLAKILFQQKKHQESITASYRVADETPAEDNWVARSFILIADNYLAIDELFQAKATLNSVIENYSGNDTSILEEAKRKRNEIEQKEKSKSNILNPSEQPNNQLQLQEN